MSLKVFDISARVLGQYRRFLLNEEESTEGFEGDVDFDIKIADLIDLEGTIGGRRGKRLFIETQNKLQGTSDALDELQEPERIARLSDFFTFKIGYEFSRQTQLAAVYRFNWTESLEKNFDRIDNITHEFGLEGKHAINPRYDLVAETIYGISTYGEDTLPDQEYQRALVGVDAQPLRRLTISLRAGGEHRKTTTTGEIDDRNDDVTTGIGQMGVSYDIGPTTKVQVDLIRQLQLSTVSNFKTTNIARARLTQMLTPKLQGVARAEVQHEEPSKGGESLRYTAGLRFDYRLTEWMTMDLDYQFQLNDSETAGSDFYNNRLTFGFNLRF